MADFLAALLVYVQSLYFWVWVLGSWIVSFLLGRGFSRVLFNSGRPPIEAARGGAIFGVLIAFALTEVAFWYYWEYDPTLLVVAALLTLIVPMASVLVLVNQNSSVE
jgi:hypothetical protein